MLPADMLDFTSLHVYILSAVCNIYASLCDIDIITPDSSQSLLSYKNSRPVILRGLLSNWPSISYFLSQYGNISVQTGYEPSIVFSNGRADDMHPIDSLSTGHRYNISDILVFDVNVLKTNPKILNDYSTPHILSHFGSDIDRDSVSPVLSIGGLNLGLPFHMHGEAWLGLVNGQKKWFLYPPGYHLPRNIQRSWRPYTGTSHWISHVLEDAFSKLKSVPYSPRRYSAQECLSTTDTDGEDCEVASRGQRGYRPLECVQMTGDVMYVPAGWSHMTLNIHGISETSSDVLQDYAHSTLRDESGLVVGIGEQAVWLASDRISLSQAIILGGNSMDCDAHRNMAVGLLSRAVTVYQQGNVSEAIVHLKQAEKHLRYDTQTGVVGDEIYETIAKESVAAAERNLNELYNELELDIQKEQGVAVALHRLATLISDELPHDAVRILEKSISIGRLNSKALAQRVFLYERLGKIAEALKALDDMELVTPGSVYIDKIRAYLKSKLVLDPR